MAGPIGTKVILDLGGFDAIVNETVKRNVTLKGVRAGIKVLVAPAKAGAPKRKGSGALKQAQGYRAAKGRRGKTVAFGVQGAKVSVQKQVKTTRGTITAKPAKYDHLVQGGTKPHTIKAKDGSWTWNHPGAKPNPYRKRAFEANKDQIAQATTKAMGAEVQRLIAKASTKVKV